MIEIPTRKKESNAIQSRDSEKSACKNTMMRGFDKLDTTRVICRKQTENPSI